jgi:hypothetical protein
MPPSTTRVSKAGWRAVAGPCTTVPSASRNVLPCHGQVTQGPLPSSVRLPWWSGHVAAQAQHGQGQVAEPAPGQAAVRQLVDTAQVVPAERGEVRDRLGVTGASAEAERQVPAQEPARGRGGEPAERQQPAAAVLARHPGQ